MFSLELKPKASPSEPDTLVAATQGRGVYKYAFERTRAGQGLQPVGWRRHRTGSGGTTSPGTTGGGTAGAKVSRASRALTQLSAADAA